MSEPEHILSVVMTSLDPAVAKRLALIRLLLSGAKETAQLQPPFDTDSINRLHDVAEMYLALACETHGGKIPGPFMEYWKEIEKCTGTAPSYYAGMVRVNKARVNLKHYGIQPNKDEVDHAVSTVENLLTDETPRLFGTALAEVSLTSFVTSDEGARAIQAAEDHWAAGEKGEAFADLSEAWGAIIAAYEETKKSVWGASLFDSMHNYRRRTRSHAHRKQLDREQQQWEGDLEDVLESLDEKILIIGFGIDLRRYVRFDSLTPGVRHMADEENRWYVIPSGWDRTDEEYTFCRDFIIAAAIRLAEFDFTYEYDGMRTFGDMNSSMQMITRSALLPPAPEEP